LDLFRPRIVCDRCPDKGSERTGGPWGVGILGWIEGVVARAMCSLSRDPRGVCRAVGGWSGSEERRDLESNAIDPPAHVGMLLRGLGALTRNRRERSPAFGIGCIKTRLRGSKHSTSHH